MGRRSSPGSFSVGRVSSTCSPPLWDSLPCVSEPIDTHTTLTIGAYVPLFLKLWWPSPWGLAWEGNRGQPCSTTGREEKTRSINTLALWNSHSLTPKPCADLVKRTDKKCLKQSVSCVYIKNVHAIHTRIFIRDQNIEDKECEKKMKHTHSTGQTEQPSAATAPHLPCPKHRIVGINWKNAE